MASPATTSRPGVMPTPAADEAAAATKALSQPAAETDDAEAAAPVNDENKQSIASIFAEGSKNIDTSRTDNLFQALEERPLTDAERAIIDARVAMQRKMYALFEKRELARKAEALIELCPELRPCEAEMALEFCKGSEAAAAEKLTGDWTFVRRVRQACGTTAPVPAPAAAEEGGAAGAGGGAGGGGAGTSSLRSDYNRHLPAAGAPRPRKIELSALGDGVFIGSFRGRAAALGPHNLASKRSGSGGDGENAEGGGGGGGGEPAAARAPSAEPPGAGAAAGKRAASAGAGPSRSRSASVAPSADAAGGHEQQQAATATTTTRRPRSASAAVPDAGAAAAAAANAGGGVRHRLVKRLPDGSVVEVSPEEARAALENAPSAAAAAAAASSPSDLASLGALVVEALLADPLPSSSSSSSSASAPFSAASFLLAMPSEALRSTALAAAGARDAERCAALVAAAGAERQLREQKQEAKLKRQQRAARIAAEEAAGAAGSAATAAAAAPVAAPPSSSAQEPVAAADEGAAAAAPSEEAAAATASVPAAAAPKRKTSAPSTRKKAGSKGAAAEEQAEEGDRIEAAGGGGAAIGATTTAAAAEEKGEAVAADAPAAPAPEAPAPEAGEADPVGAAAPPSAAPEEAAAVEAAAAAAPAAAEEAASAAAPPAAAAANPAAPSIPANAISRNGHTNRGRVRQKSSKQAQLLSVGEPVFEENARHRSLGWHNAGYIFPAGFVSRVAFRSSVSLDQVCVHECRVVGRGGVHWPAPTFEVVAMDRPDEPLVAKSCTGCWTAVLRRINAEITARIAAGEDLPPPPKTAIAGPEYFGFCQPEIADAIEGLDPGRRCVLYWAGKEERIAAMAGLPPPSHAEGPSSSSAAAPRALRVPRGGHARAPANAGGLARKGARRRRSADSDDDDDRRRRSNEEEEEEEDPEARFGNRWSGVSRAERYRKRARNTSGDGGRDAGGDAEAGDDDPDADPDNPLPGLIDPITLAPVRDPAIAPSGHVCGMATWKAVLRSTAGGGSSVCPFTKKPLSWEQCVRLTHNNVERYRDRIRT